MKFREVSWNLISNRCWKFQLAILKNKSFIPKIYFLSLTTKIDPKDGVTRPSFKGRFWWVCDLFPAQKSYYRLPQKSVFSTYFFPPKHYLQSTLEFCTQEKTLWSFPRINWVQWALTFDLSTARQKLKFINSEKATKFCEISTNYLSYVLPVK